MLNPNARTGRPRPPSLGYLAGSARHIDSLVPPDEVIRRMQFDAMATTFARHGGICGGDDMALRLRGHRGQPVSRLARAIVDRSVISLVWQAELLVPVFQFVPEDCSVRDVVAAIVRELVIPFDDWELALWFASPNLWLGDAQPIDLLLSDAPAVLGAARADRFIALG